MDFSNWNESEKTCEVQRISIQPLQCVESNVTSCGNNTDNFTLYYHEDSITLSLQDTNTSLLADKLNELSAFADWGRIDVTAVNVTEGNSTVFLVWFCFDDPRGIEVLNGTAENNQTMSLNITRLAQGRSAKDFQLIVEGVVSKVLKPSSGQEKIKKVLKNLFSRHCETSSKCKWRLSWMFYFDVLLECSFTILSS